MKTRRLVMVTGAIAAAILEFQYLTLPTGNFFSSLFPVVKVADSSVVLGVEKKREASGVMSESEHANQMEEKHLDDFEVNYADPDDDFALDDDGEPDDDFSIGKDVDLDNGFTSGVVTSPENSSTLEKDSGPKNDYLLENSGNPTVYFASNNVRKSDIVLELEKVRSSGNGFSYPSGSLSTNVSDMDGSVLGRLDVNSTSHEEQAGLIHPVGESSGPFQSVSASFSGNSMVASIPAARKRAKRRISIPEMNRLLLRNHDSSHSMKPRWSSARDRELLSAKMQIENASFVKIDHELHGPVFLNVSVFQSNRSYELMERRLKVYVYKEGEKPIFHKPYLRGIYASEGWFMKLMEENKKFVVKHPRKAHLFYMPFSSLILRIVMHKPELHSRRNLAEYLKDYVDNIAAKHPFWNRTGGADHFLVGCHDWASDITRNHFNRSIRVLCNADVSKDFKLGNDVSLPVTSVRSAQNPLKDLGGKPPSQRPILAFFAGNMHGRLRPILLKYWENKDPDMKIIGPMPPGVDHKMIYMQYMKTSKYCICPRGYEVHSPRVVEAIFYECVPVIISDNYVPPFFEVLDWEAFAVFIAEKDIPILKDILLSIPVEKYLTMQLRVKKVQRHFLWHKKPVKYDIFHMILHSVWFNRLHQLRIR